MILFFATNNL